MKGSRICQYDFVQTTVVPLVGLSSVSDCLIDHPKFLPMFNELEIDLCCDGKPLNADNRDRGLNPFDVPAHSSATQLLLKNSQARVQ